MHAQHGCQERLTLMEASAFSRLPSKPGVAPMSPCVQVSSMVSRLLGSRLQASCTAPQRTCAVQRYIRSFVPWRAVLCRRCAPVHEEALPEADQEVLQGRVAQLAPALVRACAACMAQDPAGMMHAKSCRQHHLCKRCDLQHGTRALHACSRACMPGTGQQGLSSAPAGKIRLGCLN